MTPLQRHWLALAKKHGLVIDVPFSLRLPDKTEIRAEVRLQGYGAKNGMLLISEATDVMKNHNQITAMGYGFSCLSQPSEKHIGSDDGLTDLLTDWGKC